MIHRDVKPSNLLLDEEGVVWLTDFGLAKRAGEAALTLSGALLGTPRYMSPEQAESLTRPVDHRTDVYSLGATLYEMATGHPVFESATPHGVIASILNDQPARPRQIRPSLPRDLETIILTCLAKEPARRYQTAHALAEDLRAVRDERPIRARRVPLRERMTRYVRKRKKAIGVGALTVAATSLLIVGVFLGWRSYQQSLARPRLTFDRRPAPDRPGSFQGGRGRDRRTVRRRHAYDGHVTGRKVSSSRGRTGDFWSNLSVRREPR